MQTSQFEAVKVAIKQDKTGYILTLAIHPDEISEEILRDFVGSRYQVVMVRLTEDEKPMNREKSWAGDPVRTAGILCKDKDFHRFLFEAGQIFQADETEVTAWLREELGVASRSEIPSSNIAITKLKSIQQEFIGWKQVNG